jgi:hypothetical protein
MRLTPKHVGMEISWGNDRNWSVLKKIKTCVVCDTKPHGIVGTGLYAGFSLDSPHWRVRKPQKKSSAKPLGKRGEKGK